MVTQSDKQLTEGTLLQYIGKTQEMHFKKTDFFYFSTKYLYSQIS